MEKQKELNSKMLKNKKVKYIIFVSLAVITAGILQYTHNTFSKADDKIKTEVQKIIPLYHIDKEENIVPIDPKGDKKIVLLTIDDGPKNKKTLDPILKAMADENVHAIFFSMGGFTKNHPELLKETFDAGHTIGNHTWDHANLKKSTDQKIKEEIDTTTIEINKVIGENPKIFRPPYGAYNQYAKDYVAQNRMVFTTWSLGAEDWVKKYQTKDILIKHVIEQLHPGANILMHEFPWTAEAMPEIIKQIKAKGYTIVDPKYLEYLN